MSKGIYIIEYQSCTSQHDRPRSATTGQNLAAAGRTSMHVQVAWGILWLSPSAIFAMCPTLPVPELDRAPCHPLHNW